MEAIIACVDTTCFGAESEWDLDQVELSPPASTHTTPRRFNSTKPSPRPLSYRHQTTPSSQASTYRGSRAYRTHPSNEIDPAYEYCIDYIAMHHLGDRYYLTHPLPFTPPTVKVPVKRKTEPDLLPIATAIVQLAGFLGSKLRCWYSGWNSNDCCPDTWVCPDDWVCPDNWSDEQEPRFDRRLYKPPRILEPPPATPQLSLEDCDRSASMRNGPDQRSSSHSSELIPPPSASSHTMTFRETSGESSQWDVQETPQEAPNVVFWTPNRFPPHPKYYTAPGG